MPPSGTVQRCWRCGYDRSGLAEPAVCPECGARNYGENPIDPRALAGRRARFVGVVIVSLFVGLMLLIVFWINAILETAT